MKKGTDLWRDRCPNPLYLEHTKDLVFVIRVDENVNDVKTPCLLYLGLYAVKRLGFEVLMIFLIRYKNT